MRREHPQSQPMSHAKQYEETGKIYCCFRPGSGTTLITTWVLSGIGISAQHVSSAPCWPDTNAEGSLRVAVWSIPASVQRYLGVEGMTER
jgi:hypothetical protein